MLDADAAVGGGVHVAGARRSTMCATRWRAARSRSLAYDRTTDSVLSTGTLLLVDNVIDQATATIRLKALFPQRGRAAVARRIRQRAAAVRDPQRTRSSIPDGRGAARPQWSVRLGGDGRQHRRAAPDRGSARRRRHVTSSAGVADGERVVTAGNTSCSGATRAVASTAASRHRRAGARTMNISEPFIRRPIATSLLMAAVAFVGHCAFPFLPVAPLPQVDFPTIQVTATLAGASAETMASSVAAPLERQFGQIPGVTQMTSLSALGATTIVIQFDLNRNIDSAAQDVQAAITVAGKTAAADDDDAAELPQGQSGRLADPDPGGAFRHAAAHHGQRIRRQLPRPADLAGAGRRAGHDRRRAEARRSASRSIRRSSRRAG